jgi:LmbE family N-acetylglucosaminyl deacetylase
MVSALATASAQPRSAGETGRTALGLELRRLNTAATLMMVTAHPDDENNALLAMVSKGMGVRTILATATRGEGGQNEIGPELFEELAALRSEELLAAHRIDGAEQYFTRAVDFGYSFSVEETFQKWNKDEIVGDYVRLIRMLRPEVMLSMSPAGTGGGQHHQASAVIAREAFRAAADSGRYPEQLKEGLRPWQALKFYHMATFGFRGERVPEGKNLLTVRTDIYDPLLGRTYAEAGSEARSMHKCQGFPQLLVLPGEAIGPRYELVDAADNALVGRTEKTLFDGVDLSLEAIAQHAPASRTEVAAIAQDARQALEAFDDGDDVQVVKLLVSGLQKVRALRKTSPAYELDFRLEQKERQFESALVRAHALRIETLANDAVVVAGQPVKVDVLVANRSGLPVSIRRADLAGFHKVTSLPCGGPSANGVSTCTAPDATVPPDAELTSVHWKRLPDAARYQFGPDVPFGAPFAPTPFRAQLTLDLSGAEVVIDRPVEYRYEGTIFSGEKRMELRVVPRLAVRIAPEIAILPQQGKGRELTVDVINSGEAASKGTVRIAAPSGWTVMPSTAPVTLAREDEAQAVKFVVSPPAGVAPGEYPVRAIATLDGEEYHEGYVTIEYPHIQRRHLIHEASTSIKVLDVKVAPQLTIGYVMGVGDQVPAAIEQLGARVVMLTADDLASGDLSRFNAIITGVRAYERRADLRAHNARLLEYAWQGGTVIVQYNKFEFNQAQYGPYPAKVSSGRVTDETSAVSVLDSAHPVFNTPNKITDAAWSGWVQERGLYFLGERDQQYADLVEVQDPFEYNKGPKRGALVEARVGKGRWIYLGLGLWRQLPAGTPGAYELLANLLSLK